MNKLILLFISLSLVACTVGVVSTDNDNKTITSDNYQTSIQEDGLILNPCDKVESHTVVIDGQSVTFNIPALCNPNPQIDRGDPPPDVYKHNVLEIISTPISVSPNL